ncbi:MULTISPECIES: hypothetical protein [Streptacidiphilus]|uniref:PIN domain-containing protein n=1 Tax=Streptacidiphilus cavernicola TaxID=3342716 RepID=A0ABV6UW66_9ACTN|nr:hypothetical protein [Streptacidiphilus jeojiense]
MIILDTSAVTALASGHRKLARIAENAARSPFRHLLVPALCLMQAEVAEADAGLHALSLPGIDIEALDPVAAIAVAAMVRDGYGAPDTAHALYATLPSAHRPEADLLLTARHHDYPPGTITIDIDDDRLLD